MCGRFSLVVPERFFSKVFVFEDLPEMMPDYNIPPGVDIWAVRNGPQSKQTEIARLRWGLVPHWAKDPKIGHRMINARSETVAEKPAFKAAFNRRRCLIPADGFYEWQRQGDQKVPHFITLASGEPFALAGLWERWKDKQTGDSLQTTTLITTEANEFMAPLHHRMPVVLVPPTADEWLAGSNDLLDDVAARTPPLQAWPVDRRVNNARNEGEELKEAAGDIVRGASLVVWAIYDGRLAADSIHHWLEHGAEVGTASEQAAE